MRKINYIFLEKNKTIIIFLLKFFITYFVLFGIYSFYLSRTQVKTDLFSCSPITTMVGSHVQEMSNLLGYDAYVEQNSDELSMKFIINGKYVSRIIEGCNAVSVIILFLAFIIAFSGTLKATILFGIFGSLLIYLVNLFRIIALSILYYKFPEYQEILHNLVFPSIIYGITFVLWITWVKYFSNISKNGNKKGK